MRKNANIQIKGFYTCKVTNEEVTIQIVSSSPKGGWEAVNTKTGKKIHIKGPERLIKKVAAPKTKTAKKTTKPKGKSKSTKQPKVDKNTNVAEKPATDKTPKTEKKLSLVGAAIQILQKAKEPMSCKDIVEQALEQKFWQPTKGGKTPANTLYSAFLREIKTKDENSRFVKAAPGRFTLNK